MAYSRSFDEDETPLEPVCRQLRSKAIYVTGMMEPPAGTEYMGSGHCWCHHTQQPIGPDGLHVLPDQCVPGRVCYRSALASLT